MLLPLDHFTHTKKHIKERKSLGSPVATLPFPLPQRLLHGLGCIVSPLVCRPTNGALWVKAQSQRQDTGDCCEVRRELLGPPAHIHNRKPTNCHCSDPATSFSFQFLSLHLQQAWQQDRQNISSLTLPQLLSILRSSQAPPLYLCTKYRLLNCKSFSFLQSTTGLLFLNILFCPSASTKCLKEHFTPQMIISDSTI